MRKTILLLLILSLTLAIGIFPLPVSANNGRSVSVIEPLLASILFFAIVMGILFIFVIVIENWKNKSYKKRCRSLASQSNKSRNTSARSSSKTVYREGSALLKEYEKSFQAIIALPIVKKCKNYRPLTAAILFIYSDLFLIEIGEERKMKSEDTDVATTMAMQRRNRYAREIFRYIESIFDNMELSTFDKAVSLLADIANGEIDLRADWYGGPPPSLTRPLTLYYAYGDLMRFPNYLDDYEHARICIYPIDESVAFIKDFSAVPYLLADFVEKFERKEFRDAL